MNDRAYAAPAIPRMPPHPLHAHVTPVGTAVGLDLTPTTALDEAVFRARRATDTADSLAAQLDVLLTLVRGEAPQANIDGNSKPRPVADGKLGELFRYQDGIDYSLQRIASAVSELRSHL
ncbi:hypothetical protein UFOVP326_44 [uncultured Caudovirales phage]|uniref:Uncharacterized protein n=1 Tax=uncultured Caudovirales phage TaxID=2100421 RepID=A0A6J5LU28_9CAUD|nr:hypothetical protein UFOVP326_44 [uncultured Caudovirales phage]